MAVTSLTLLVCGVKASNPAQSAGCAQLGLIPPNPYDSSSGNVISYNHSTDWETTSYSFAGMFGSPSAGGDLIIVSGCITGAFFCPVGSNINLSLVSNSAISVNWAYNTYTVSAKSFSVDDDVQGVSENGQYYYDSDGDYYDIFTDNLVADSSDLQNLPSGITFNGWLLDDSIIVGSDGKYYDLSGTEVMQNLPSNVTLSSQIGNIYVGSDGNYYNSSGNEVMENLPSGVTIVSYDSVHDCYVGSDGNNYDVNGNSVSLCDGDLLNYSNTIRLEIIGVDIFGNDVSVGGNVTVGQNSVEFPAGTLIREIKRIVARDISDSLSCGDGLLTISADVVGAKIGLDYEGVDVDVVLGSYKVADCLFRTCDKYADYILNEDLPLGFANLTALDIGYYCCTSVFQLSWQGFDNIGFPYCCNNYDDSVNESGGIGKTNDKLDVDVDCLCEHLVSIDNSFNDLNLRIASLIESVDSLLCICGKIDDLISAINNKNFSITVQPATPSVTVTNPVNNVTVEPCSPVVTNPVNNITVQPATPSVTVTNPVNNITVEPCEPVIQNTINEGDCSTDLTPLIDKLDEVFKTGSDDDFRNITQVIDDKDFGGFTDVTIEPYDLVNIRRAFRDDNNNE